MNVEQRMPAIEHRCNALEEALQKMDQDLDSLCRAGKLDAEKLQDVIVPVIDEKLRDIADIKALVVHYQEKQDNQTAIDGLLTEMEADLHRIATDMTPLLEMADLCIASERSKKVCLRASTTTNAITYAVEGINGAIEDVVELVKEQGASTFSEQSDQLAFAANLERYHAKLTALVRAKTDCERVMGTVDDETMGLQQVSELEDELDRLDLVVRPLLKELYRLEDDLCAGISRETTVG